MYAVSPPNPQQHPTMALRLCRYLRILCVCAIILYPPQWARSGSSVIIRLRVVSCPLLSEPIQAVSETWTENIKWPKNCNIRSHTWEEQAFGDPRSQVLLAWNNLCTFCPRNRNKGFRQHHVSNTSMCFVSCILTIHISRPTKKDYKVKVSTRRILCCRS